MTPFSENLYLLYYPRIAKADRGRSLRLRAARRRAVPRTRRGRLPLNVSAGVSMCPRGKTHWEPGESSDIAHSESSSAVSNSRTQSSVYFSVYLGARPLVPFFPRLNHGRTK